MYFFTCGQIKAESGHSDSKEVGDRKKEHPTLQVPTIINQSALSKVKTVMQVPPDGRRLDNIAENNT